MKFWVIIACVVMLVEECRGGKAKCKKPNGMEGDVLVEGCDQWTCTAYSNKKGIWVEGPAIGECCVHNGTLTPLDTVVDLMSPDHGCTEMSMVCEMCEEGPCIQPHIEFTCYETLSQGMQQILDYFFPDYNSQKPWGTNWPEKTSPSPWGKKTYPPFVTGTQKPYTGTYKPSEGSCYCGLAERGARIVGGQDTEVNEYPWQAGIVNKGQHDFVWCGGSLINSKWVLTAAHCTQGSNAKSIEVLLGEHDYYSTDETDHWVARVDKIIDHPDYDDSTLHNDFSMLRLKEAVDFEAYPHIRPVCLPYNKDETYAGEGATVTGWGTTSSGGDLSYTLKEVNVTVLTNKNCWKQYGYSSDMIDGSMICANVDGGGKDACQGDSGGPLVTSNGGNGVSPGQNYELIGVVSWGIGCAEEDYPGVYARVTDALDWIYDTMEDGESCPRYGDQKTEAPMAP